MAIGQGFHAKPSPTLGSLPAGLNSKEGSYIMRYNDNVSFFYSEFALVGPSCTIQVWLFHLIHGCFQSRVHRMFICLSFKTISLSTMSVADARYFIEVAGAAAGCIWPHSRIHPRTCATPTHMCKVSSVPNSSWSSALDASLPFVCLILFFPNLARHAWHRSPNW